MHIVFRVNRPVMPRLAQQDPWRPSVDAARPTAWSLGRPVLRLLSQPVPWRTSFPVAHQTDPLAIQCCSHKWRG